MLRVDFANFYNKTAFVKVCRAKANVTTTRNAISFFSRFKAELMECGVFENIGQARSEIFSYIEDYYNRVRLHSVLGYTSLMEIEIELESKNGENKGQFSV